jgi:hypothetical protein
MFEFTKFSAVLNEINSWQPVPRLQRFRGDQQLN